MDTVKRDGKGFDPQVKDGETVKKGQLLTKFDLDGIKADGYDAVSYTHLPEVAAECVKRIESGKYDVVILNFANCDMVGHTGVFDACLLYTSRCV